MAWLRIGDNAATHPFMARLLSSTGAQCPDHAVKNEAFGVLTQLAAISAGHLTDGVIETGMLSQIAPGREAEILDVLVAAGLAQRGKEDDRHVILLVLDDEEFIHARGRAEVEIDRARSRDKRVPGLYIQVRVRDGDECRWCGRTVSWTNRSGDRGGVIDSLNGHQDSTVDTLVVACRGCNSRRGQGIDLVLKNAPANPYYSEGTIRYVNKDKWSLENNVRIQPRQTELDITSTTSEAAASAAAQGRASQAAAVHAAPATADPHAAAQTAAPGGWMPAVESSWDDAPDWVTRPADEILGSSVAAQGRASQAAAVHAAPATADPHAAAQT
ncbi:HNH endonuclease, partial [Corynebacterium glutamicum]|uniref:HNH endonuclease n=1 Tax=Corynebacterium glutamicum TaxID=1718 RepID=UPI0009434719